MAGEVPQLRIDCGIGLALGARATQQDVALAEVHDFEEQESSTQALMAVLCDGMGGTQGGGAASLLCAEGMRGAFLQLETPDFNSFYIGEARRLDALVAEMRSEEGEPIQAGTTLTSVVLMQGVMHWFSVGDSRLYIFRGNALTQVTVDHGCGNLLSSFIGIGGLQSYDCSNSPFSLAPGDILLLCSDGLYRTLTPDEIARQLDQGLDAQETAGTLVCAALDRQMPNQDNISVIIINLEETK